MEFDFKQAAVQHLNAGGKMGMMDASSLMYSGGMMDKQKVMDSMAFLVGELEKVDPTLLEPLTSFTYARDIVQKPGGGWVQFVSTIDVDYATTGGNEYGIYAPSTTEIASVQANLNKDQYKVFTFLEAFRVPFVNDQLLRQTGRSLEEIFDKGIKLTYNKMMDKNTYTGFDLYGTTGLINNPKVVSTVAENGSNGTSDFTTKTPDEILSDLNDLIINVWTASEYSPDGIINHILMPPTQFGLLTTRKVSEAGNVSILTYLLENNIATKQGVDLKIYPSRWLVGAGVNGTDRMVGYVNDEKRINIDTTVPLGRVMTAPNITNVSIDSVYAAQVSEVKVQYHQTIAYMDGI